MPDDPLDALRKKYAPGGATAAADPLDALRKKYKPEASPPTPVDAPASAPVGLSLGTNRDFNVPLRGITLPAGHSSDYIPRAYEALAEADALTGQHNADNPEFRKAFETDGVLDEAKTEAHLARIREDHSKAIPALPAVAAKFGKTVASGTTLGFWKGGRPKWLGGEGDLSPEDEALIEANPTVQGPLGQVAGAAGTVLAAANPWGPVAQLSKAATALKIPTAGAVGFGTASGIEHRSPAAGLEAYGFAAGAGGIGGKLAGPTAGAVRRGLSEAVGVGALSTASSALHGERPDWAGILAQMGFFGLASAGKVSPLSRAGGVAVRRAEAIAKAVPEAAPQDVAKWVAGDAKGIPPDMATKMGAADRPVLDAHKAEVDRESLPAAKELEIRQEAKRRGVDPEPLIEAARKPVDLTTPVEPEIAPAAAPERAPVPEAPPAAPVAPEPAAAPAEAPAGARESAPVAASAPEAHTPILAPIGKTRDGRRVVTADDLPDAKGAADATWYHGTGAKGLRPDTLDTIGASDPQGLVGMGLYLTDSPEIAGTYAAKRGKRTGTPTTYEAKVNPRAVLNFERPLPRDVADAIQSMADGMESSSAGAGQDVRAAIEAGKSGMDVYKAFRDALASDQVPTSEAVEPLQHLQGALRDLGYDAISHIGGTRAGKGEALHRVLVVLDPNYGYSRGGKWEQPYANPITSMRDTAHPGEVAEAQAGSEIVQAAPVKEGEVVQRPGSVLDAAERAGIPGAKEARENLDSLPDSTTRWDPVEKRWTRDPVEPAIEGAFQPPAPKTRAFGRKSAATLQAEGEGKSLSQLVRAEGGIAEGSHRLTGEIEMLSQKESATSGLVGRKGRGKTPEQLIQAAKEAGFDMEGVSPDQFVQRLLDNVRGAKDLSPATMDVEKLGEASLRRQAEEGNARLAELPPAERARVEAENQARLRETEADLAMERAEREAIQAEARGEMADADTSFDFGANVTGTTREGEPVSGTVARTTEKSVVLDNGKRIPKDKAKAAPPDEAVPSAGIDAGLNVLRGGKPGPTPKTSGEAGFLDLPTVGKALGKVAFGAPRVVETGLDVADTAARGIVKAAGRIPGISHAVEGFKIAKRLVREKMDPFLLPREYLSRVAEKEGREALTRHDAKDDARFLANFPDGKPLTKDHQEAATKFLTKEATREEAVKSLGEDYVKRLDTARSEIDARQAELGALNVLTAETIAKWGGKYLKRMYTVVEAAKREGEIPKDIPVGGKRIGKIHQRQDIPAMMREFLGEVRDPAVLVAQTRMAQEGMIATAKFLKRVSEDPRWSSDTPRDGLSPDPLGDSKRYGALAGKYLHPRIKADVEATFRDHNGLADNLAQVIDTTLSEWKFGKTVLNPGTHGRNVIGNGFYAALEGNNWADPLNWKNGIDAIKIMASKKGDPLYDVKRALIAERIMGGDYLSADVLETAALVAKARGSTWLEKMRDYMKSLDAKAGKGRVFEAMPGADKVAALYQLEDVLPKVASYVSKVKGRLGRPAMSHSEASQAVRDAYPTFDATAPGRSVLHMRGLAGALTRQVAPPFISYTLAAARTISKQALLHPARAAALVAALKWVMYGMSDTDEKTKRKIEASVDKYKRPGVGAGFLPWNDSNGDRQLLDLRYTVPLGDEFQTIVDWFSEKDEPGLRSIQPGPFVWTAAQLLLNKNALTGRPIDSSKEDASPGVGKVSPEQGTADTWRFIGQQMLPAMFPGGYSWNKISEAASGVAVDRHGKYRRDPTITLLDTIAGVKIRSVNLRREQDIKLVDIDSDIKAHILQMKRNADDVRMPESAKQLEHDRLQAAITRLYIQSLRVRGEPDPKAGAKVDMTGDFDNPEDDQTPRKLFQGAVNRARERLSPGGR